MRWAASPPNSVTANTRVQTLESSPSATQTFSEEMLQTPGSPDKAQEELLREQLQLTSRRMQEVQSEVEQGSRALDVANVNLAEQLLLCSTISAKLLWPEDIASEPLAALDAAQGKNTACTIDPFLDEYGLQLSAPLPEFFPDNPLESLSASESDDVVPIMPSFILSQDDINSPNSEGEKMLQKQREMTEYVTGLAHSLGTPRSGSAMSTPREDKMSPMPPIAPRLRMRGASMMPGLYGQVTDYVLRQCQKQFKRNVFTSWHSLARERSWTMAIVKGRINQGECGLKVAVLQEWNKTCSLRISWRRAHAKVEMTAERNNLRKCLQEWGGHAMFQMCKKRLSQSMRKRVFLRRCSSSFVAWAAASSCQQLSVHECDWDCGFTGAPAEVAYHETNCEAMLLATEWKRETELSLRPRAEGVSQEVNHDRERLMRWLPAIPLPALVPTYLNACCATGALRGWLPKDSEPDENARSVSSASGSCDGEILEVCVIFEEIKTHCVVYKLSTRIALTHF